MQQGCLLEIIRERCDKRHQGASDEEDGKNSEDRQPEAAASFWLRCYKAQLKLRKQADVTVSMRDPRRALPDGLHVASHDEDFDDVVVARARAPLQARQDVPSDAHRSNILEMQAKMTRHLERLVVHPEDEEVLAAVADAVRDKQRLAPFDWMRSCCSEQLRQASGKIAGSEAPKEVPSAVVGDGQHGSLSALQPPTRDSEKNFLWETQEALKRSIKGYLEKEMTASRKQSC